MKSECYAVVSSRAAAEFHKLPVPVRDLLKLCDGTRTIEAISAVSQLPIERAEDVLRRLIALGVVTVQDATSPRQRKLTPRGIHWLQATAPSQPIAPAPVNVETVAARSETAKAEPVSPAPTAAAPASADASGVGTVAAARTRSETAKAEPVSPAASADASGVGTVAAARTRSETAKAEPVSPAPSAVAPASVDASGVGAVAGAPTRSETADAGLAPIPVEPSSVEAASETVPASPVAALPDLSADAPVAVTVERRSKSRGNKSRGSRSRAGKSAGATPAPPTETVTSHRASAEVPAEEPAQVANVVERVVAAVAGTEFSDEEERFFASPIDHLIEDF